MKGDPRENAHEREQYVESDGKCSHQAAAAKQLPHLVRKRQPRRAARRRLMPALPMRQPRGHRNRSHQRYRSEHHKADPPTEGLSENPANEPPRETAQRRSTHIKAHDQRHAIRRPLFADISDHHGEDARQRNPLEKSPEDKLCQRSRSRRQQRRHRNADQRKHNHALARHPLRKRTK